MQKVFNRERFGKPQVLAGLLLLVFLAQCLWLVAHISPGAVSTEEFARVQDGLAQWHTFRIAGIAVVFRNRPDASLNLAYGPNHSPLWYLIESAPLALFRADLTSALGIWLSRIPYLFIGTMLGASLWYVSRRLYGNNGGYIALSLYCFSPAVIRSTVLWFAPPNIAGAWGTFGAVFTAIAVSHTLYAPREVILWNWRRIVLLGISLALAIGSRFSLVIVLPLLIIFMLYVAWERRAAALAIFLASCAIASFLLFLSYFLQWRTFFSSLLTANWFDLNGPALVMAGAWLPALRELAASGPVLLLLGPAALIGYALWPRPRYFGNSAPLMVAVSFLVWRAGTPHQPNSVFGLIAVVFLFLFIAGVAADFLETSFRELTASIIAGLLVANALWNLIRIAAIHP
jgi:hypothetical protein